MDDRKKKVYERSLEACVQNGNRLVEDAQLLLDWDRFASTVALSILAQEEFAKAFLLRLVIDETVPWVTEVHRSLKDHSSKHLLGLVVDWLSSLLGDFWEELQHLEERRKNPQIVADEEVPWPKEVANALNLYRFERLENWRIGYTAYSAGENSLDGDRTLRKASAHDRKKQDAFYVRLGSDGQCAAAPRQITMETAKSELDKAQRFGRFAEDYFGGALSLFSTEYRMLAEACKVVFATLESQEDMLRAKVSVA